MNLNKLNFSIKLYNEKYKKLSYIPAYTAQIANKKQLMLNTISYFWLKCFSQF